MHNYLVALYIDAQMGTDSPHQYTQFAIVTANDEVGAVRKYEEYYKCVYYKPCILGIADDGKVVIDVTILATKYI